ncbi:MAG: hypothetical protein SWK90_14365 [Chloroflexota bacterium]|nr:hypothetical protein [Chloroflexota bacterium]
MTHLHQLIQQNVAAWREDGYPTEYYAAIAEILDYLSYILALAMGAGKTILIGAIVASEFAMALEYPGRQHLCL